MNIHKRKKRISVYLAIILLIATWMPNIMQAEASETRTIRVAFPVQEGMSTFHQDGTPDGYSYMYLEKIAEYTGWKMEYVPYDGEDENKNIQNAMEDLQSGKVDLMGPLLKSESMEELFSFPEQSYGIVYTTLCALETSDLREDNAASQNPLKVGLWKQAETRNSEVLSYLERQNFNYELHYYETSEEQKQALEDGEVDVISNVSLSKISGTRIIERFAPRPYYFASSKKNMELVQELDKAISIINQVQPSLQDALFDKYFRDTRYTFALTEQQKQYLMSLNELRVICVDEDAPYVYQREGKPAGMLIEVLEDFSKETGVSINYTFCADRSEAEQKITERKYDIMIGSPFTSQYCAEIGFVRSKSIIESGLAYLHNPENTRHDTVAVKTGLENLVDTTDFATVLICESDMECIEAVTNGKADYAIGDQSGLEYYMYDTYSNLITSQVSGATQNICIAIARDSDLQLIRLLNDYIYSLSDLQKNMFLEEGNTHVYKATLQSYVRLHPMQAVLLVAIVTAFVAAAVFMLIHAKKMHKKNEELEKANAAKSEFLTRMSHDIRTPMNGIIGLLDISDKFADNPEAVKEYHKKIRVASEYLLSLLNDVLDMSKLDSDEIVFAEDSVYLREIMENCRDILGAKAAEYGIELETLELEAFNPPRVFASEMHLRQIVMNIVSNAIKYNKPNGKIIATTEVIAQTEDTVICRFVVKDTGIGMSESFQKQMFMPFSQEHGENRSEFKGTGLGLSIVKRIIDKMGGEIHVESEKDVGTKFIWTLTFQIDKEYQEKEKKIKTANIDFTGKHILAAEDNTLNAEILIFLLENLGAEVTLVENGKLAVEAFEQSEIGSYNCVLLDVMMPVMDGYMASRKIRELSRPDAKTVPIIALTANAFAEDAKKSVEAGMNAHITKPIDANKLKSCIARLISN